MPSSCTRRGRLGLPLLLAIAGGGLLPAAANAGTLAVKPLVGPDGVTRSTLVFTGGVERNTLSVTFVMDGSNLRTLVSDGAPVTLDASAATHCTPDQWDPGFFRCDAPPAIALAGGGGNDRLTVSTPFDADVSSIRTVTLDGGAGDDDLVGSDLADRLVGGAGDDVIAGNAGGDVLDAGSGDDDLRGGDGADRLLAGAGDDLLSGDRGAGAAPLAADVLDGGAGTDTLVAEWIGGQADGGLPARVRVTQDGRADDGRFKGGRSEGDDVTSVEHIDAGADDLAVDGTAGADVLSTHNGGSAVSVLRGLAGNDTLTGREGRDTLDGGPGADLVRGGSGDDVLTGGPGSDIIQGDAPNTCTGGYGCVGNDVIRAVDGERDSITCGLGLDTVYADVVDIVDADCEVVHRAAPKPALAIVRRPSTSLPAALRSGLAIGVRITGNGRLAATATIGRTRVGQSTATVRTGARTVTVVLSAATRRTLAHRSAATVGVRVVLTVGRTAVVRTLTVALRR